MVRVFNRLFVSDHHFCLALSHTSVVVGLWSVIFSFLWFRTGLIRLCLTIAGKKKKYGQDDESVELVCRQQAAKTGGVAAETVKRRVSLFRLFFHSLRGVLPPLTLKTH